MPEKQETTEEKTIKRLNVKFATFSKNINLPTPSTSMREPWYGGGGFSSLANQNTRIWFSLSLRTFRTR